MSTTVREISAAELTGDYAFDPAHTRFGFVARHAVVTKVRGAFNVFQGSAHVDFVDPTKSSVQVTVDMASVDTRNEQRDAHLRTNDFFDAPNFPEMTFTSTSVRKVSDEVFEVTGDLTIKGVTRPVTFRLDYQGQVTDPWGNIRIGFDGSATINRKDWGVNFNSLLETGQALVSDKITLEIEISAVRQAPEAGAVA